MSNRAKFLLLFVMMDLLLVVVVLWWFFGAMLSGSAEPEKIGREAPTVEGNASDGENPTAPSGWPNLFGPRHDSISTETGLVFEWPEAGPPVLWRREVDDAFSAPVLADDRLILFQRRGDEEVVECADPETGQSRWEFAYPCTYQTKYPDHGDASGPKSTPLIDGDRVYALGIEGMLHCLKLDDGSLLWQRPLNKQFEVESLLYGVGASPLVDDDRLIINVGGEKTNAGVVALDKLTGETLWTATDQPAAYATPTPATIHGKRYVFVLTDRGLVSLDPSSGKVHWSIDFRAKNPERVNATSPLVLGDKVLISAFAVGSLCVRVMPDGSYKELWFERRGLDSQYNNLLSIDGYVYGFSALEARNSFRCLDMATGKVQWKYPSKLAHGLSLAVEGHFILVGEHGHLVSMRIDPGRPLTVSATPEPILPSPCMIAPALHRGRLYLRNRFTLLCLDLTGKQTAAELIATAEGTPSKPGR